MKTVKTFEAFVDSNGELNFKKLHTVDNIDKWDAINTWSQNSDMIHPIYKIGISSIIGDISDMDSYEDIEDDKPSYIKDWKRKYNMSAEDKEKRLFLSKRLFNDLVELSKEENVLQNYVDELNTPRKK